MVTVGVAFTSIVAALAVVLGASPGGFSRPTTAGQPAQEGQRLEAGRAIARDAFGGERHVYDITLQASEHATVVIDPRAVDVRIRVLGIDGGPVAEADTDIHSHRSVTLAWVADRAGVYRAVLEVKGAKSKAGQYEIRVVEIRPATETDRVLHEAARLATDSIRLIVAGKYEQAIPIAERTLAMRRTVLGPEHRDIATALSTLGSAFRFTGDFGKAEQLFNQALAIYEKVLGPDHVDVAGILHNLAIVHRRRADFDKAEELYQRSLAINEKTLGPEHAAVAATLNSLAALASDQGHLDKAEQIYNRALRIREKTLGPAHPEVAQTLNNLGSVYGNRGDLDKSEQVLRRALDIREKALGAEHPEIVSSLGNLARIRARVGDLQEAELLLRRALAIREKALGPEHPDLATAVQNLADLSRTKGDAEGAAALFRRALAIRSKTFGPDHPLVAESLVGVAATERIRGDYQAAEQLYARALAVADKALGPQHPRVADVLNDMAVLQWARGDAAAAVSAQSRANRITDHNVSLNVAIGSERQKLAYLEMLSAVADRTISLHAQGAPDNPHARELAAATILQRKGRVLDALTDSLAALRRRFTDVDRNLLDQLNGVVARLANLSLTTTPGGTGAAHQQQITQLEQQREQLEDEISRRSAEFRAHARSTTLADVRTAIPADAVLVEFATYRPFDPKAAVQDRAYGKPRYIAYVLRADGDINWRDLGDARTIDEQVGQLRQALRDPSRRDVVHLARTLDEQVMHPLRPWLAKASRVLVSPDGDLNLIPFEALRDEQGRYLVERHAITYLTSGRDLPRLQVTRESKSAPLVIANPAFDDRTPSAHAASPGAAKPALVAARRSITVGRELADVHFAPLAGTAHEARAIQALFPDAAVLTGVRATKSALKGATAPRLLHVATHGFFLERATSANPLLRSGLALAGANRSTRGESGGILTALEATGLNLWGTKLVTLSACDTGVGEVKSGEGVYGLRRALVLAGAETLVMSLWPVSDYQTREMMREYYKGLRQGQGRGDALRQVKLTMLRAGNRRHPFYWASFIQSGEWGSLDGKQ